MLPGQLGDLDRRCTAVTPPIHTWSQHQSAPVAPSRQRLTEHGHTSRRPRTRTPSALGVLSAGTASAAWALLHPTLALIAPLPPPIAVHHAPRLAEIINVCMLAATAGGSCVLATAKYLHESGMRRAQMSLIPSKPHLLHGVDISNSKYLQRPKVLAAAEFAAEAHKGQHRRTGEPYISHCVHTAAIVEALMAQNHVQEADQRAEKAVIAALLHDTLDDTSVTLGELQLTFGPEVAACVEHVSRLSELNQMLRRHLRQQASGSLGQAQRLPLQEAEALRHMMICLTDEPLGLAIKLADRLHNMRTCHALKPDKRAAVAIETLEVWCSLAEQLGMFPLKAELEDLCFAVLQPAAYASVRSQLDTLWGAPPRAQLRAPSAPPQPPAFQPQPPPGAQEPAAPPQLPLLAAAARQQVSPSAQAQAGSPRKPLQLLPEDQAPSPSFLHDCPTMYIDEAARPARDGSASASTTPATMNDDEAWAQVFTLLRSRKELRRMQQRPVPDALQDPADVPQYAADGLPRPRRKLRSKYEAPASRQAWQLAASSSWSEAQPVADRGPRHTEPPARLTEEQLHVHELLKTVASFESTVFKLPVRGPAPPISSAMGPLVSCAYALRQELSLSHAAVGLDIQVEARLKSLYSTHKKMQRKGIPVSGVYDTRALRVIVNDAGRRVLPDAVEACYAILPVVHRLWRQVLREADDYIANPTPSGYQSLHTAVTDMQGIPMEVQIRTSSMHEVAEYGPAAHWAYKARGANPANPTRTVQVGMPVMRSDGGKLRLGVVLGSEREARELSVAIATGSRLLPGAQVSAQDCRNLMQYVEGRGWDQAGEGDWNVRLERYLLCADGKYHAVDFFDRRQAVTVTPIYGWKKGFFAPDPQAPPSAAPSSRTEAHYQSIQAEFLAETGRITHQAPLSTQLPHLKTMGRAGTPLVPRPSSPQAPAADKAPSTTAAPRRRTDPDKIRALRRKLENSPSTVGSTFKEAEAPPKDISVFLWPAHRIVHLPEGTTAGHVLRTQGSEEAMQILASDSAEQDLVNVNNHLVPASTLLANGDYVVFSKQRLDINRQEA